MSQPNSENIDIDYVAQLARLELSPEEKVRFADQIKQILGHFRKIDQVDVSGVEPTAHAFPVFNVWDEDIVKPGLAPEQALRNAPAQRENQVVVPRVVEG